MELLILLGVLVLVTIAALIDLRTREIPDIFAALLLLIPVCQSVWWWEWRYLTSALVGGGIMFVPLYVSACFGYLGAGDLKLGVSLGFALGLQKSIFLLLYSGLGAGVIGLIGMFKGYGILKHRYSCPTDAEMPYSEQQTVPLGFSFVIGVLGVWVSSQLYGI